MAEPRSPLERTSVLADHEAALSATASTAFSLRELPPATRFSLRLDPAIAADIGAIGGFLGGISGLRWIVRAVKLMRLIKPLVKEGYQVIDEGLDLRPVAETLISQAKDIKIGDTSKGNMKKIEKTLSTALVLAKEAQEVMKEVDDVKNVLLQAKDIL